MNPIQAVLRSVDRYQQRHVLLGLPFAVVKKFGDDQTGNLATLLAWNAFFALLPLLLVLVTVLGYLLGHHPALQEQILRSAFAEFPIVGTQLQQNVHSLRGNGFGLAFGMVASLWGARGVTQAGQFAMAEIWNIPARERPSCWARQARGLALLLVLVLGLAATTLLTGLGSHGSRSAAFRVGNLAGSAAVNVGLFLLAFRVLTPRQVPVRRLVVGSVVAGDRLAGAAGGRGLPRRPQPQACHRRVRLLRRGARVAVLALPGQPVDFVRRRGERRAHPAALAAQHPAPPSTKPDERVLIDLAKQQERRPEESVRVGFTHREEAPADPSSR